MNDFTYDIAKASIVTVLEPCMGLIAACLPMSPPVFKRILRGKDSRNYVSSNVARLRSKDSKKPAFLKIEDQHSHTDLEEPRIYNDITGPNSNPDSLVDDQNTNTKLEMYPQSTIKITQDWEVRSDEAV